MTVKMELSFVTTLLIKDVRKNFNKDLWEFLDTSQHQKQVHLFFRQHLSQNLLLTAIHRSKASKSKRFVIFDFIQKQTDHTRIVYSCMVDYRSPQSINTSDNTSIKINKTGIVYEPFTKESYRTKNRKLF